MIWAEEVGAPLGGLQAWGPSGSVSPGLRGRDVRQVSS